MSTNISTEYARLRSEALNRTSSRANMYMNVNTSYKLGETYTAQGYGGFWTGGVQLQTSLLGRGVLWPEPEENPAQGKGRPHAGANNFLAPGRAYRSSTTTDRFVSADRFYQYQRNFRLSFNYRFGKLEGGGRQRRTIQNNDSKQGSSGGQGG